MSEVLPDIIEIGLDVLYPVQPEARGMRRARSMRFEDKTAIITGAARGIGEEVAHRFPSEGGIIVTHVDVADSE